MDKLNIYHQLLDLGDNLEKMNDDELEELVETLKAINFEEIVKYLLVTKDLDDMDL